MNGKIFNNIDDKKIKKEINITQISDDFYNRLLKQKKNDLNIHLDLSYDKKRGEVIEISDTFYKKLLGGKVYDGSEFKKKKNTSNPKNIPKISKESYLRLLYGRPKK